MSFSEQFDFLQAPRIAAVAAFVAIVVVGWLVAVVLGRRPGADRERRRVGRALRTPVRIAAVAIGAWAASTLVPADAEARVLWGMLGRIALVLAVGFAVAKIGDLWIRRRVSELNLDAEDNLVARQSATRLGILRRIWAAVFTFVTVVAALTVVPQFRSLGLSLFASAGVAGLVIGIAAGPVLTNLFAGIQVAVTQPIRLEDAVVVEGEWGWIEEIGLFHVVIRIWDWRRLVVPLRYFVDTPFQNWTKTTAAILGAITWRVDYTAPIAEIRAEVERIVKSHPLWDGQAFVLQVVDADERSIELRALASAKTSPKAWDLRCDVREKVIVWLQENHPACLPKVRLADADGERGPKVFARAGPPAGEATAPSVDGSSRSE